MGIIIFCLFFSNRMYILLTNRILNCRVQVFTGLCQTSKNEAFVKIVIDLSTELYYCKKFHLPCLAVFGIMFFIGIITRTLLSSDILLG